MLLHYLCPYLLLLFGSLSVKSAQWDRPETLLSGPSSHSILSSVFTPCPFHHSDIRLSTLPHLCYVLILSHLTRHTPPLAFSSGCHPSLYPTDEGGKGGGGKKKKKHRYHFSRTIILHFRSLSNPISPLSPFTLHPRHRPPRIVFTCLSDCPRAGLLLPPPCATPGIASLPLPGWASPWSPTALSMMSLLRQAKIY